MHVRRIVTGVSREGVSIIVRDDEVPLVAFGDSGGVHPIWGRDESPQLPLDGSPVPFHGPLPPPGGCRASVLRIRPGASDQFNSFVMERFGELADKDAPGMHCTPSLDFAVVLSGVVGLELDNGESTVLRAGDVVVQNGTRHRWSNLGDVEAVIAAVLIGAEAAR